MTASRASFLVFSLIFVAVSVLAARPAGAEPVPKGGADPRSPDAHSTHGSGSVGKPDAPGELAALAGSESVPARLALRSVLRRRAKARQRAHERARQRELSARITSAGPLRACPVGHPRRFIDDFGVPRPGGRYHEGIDMLAPYRTPVYAAQPGTVERRFNYLGGITLYLHARGGDFTYYAHLSGYSNVPDGARVQAGTLIGYVGNTGDAAWGPFHLHFEYHPGGGGAVDPYRYLVDACGT